MNTIKSAWRIRAWAITWTCVAAGAASGALAQSSAYPDDVPIPRVKMTDSEMSCEQIYADVGEMDRILAATRDSQSASQNTAVAAGAAAQVAPVANVLVTRIPFGGLFGQVAGQAVQQSASNSAQSAAERTRQATLRKDALTTLFLNRQCKASEMPAPQSVVNKS